MKCPERSDQGRKLAGRRNVEERKRMVVELDAKGHETWLARELLAESENTLRAYRAHLSLMTGK